MKRTVSSIALLTSLLLLVSSTFVFDGRARAEQDKQPRRGKKASAELIKRIDQGKGGELVKVIVQPAPTWDDTTESTVRNSGAGGMRGFRNLNLRVLTLPANAAMALASRSDVAFVSVDKEVRSLGHLSVTTGADNARAN